MRVEHHHEVAAGRRLAILAEGTFDFFHGKTAVGILRYRPADVAAVIDRDHNGQTAAEVVGVGGAVPVVEDLEAARAAGATALLIGVAPTGGALPAPWRRIILDAIAAGMDVISGLHTFLADDPELAVAARSRGVRLIDVRRPPPLEHVADLRPRRDGARVVTFVGSDCAVGKMTAALEMSRAAREMGIVAAFVATGQTGIMIEGSGVPLDRMIGDFMAGAIEELVVEAAERADLVFVEGQGSLLHPGYSGVTLALLHGSQPDAMVLVHPPGRQTIAEYPVPIPSLPRLIGIYEDAAGWVKPAPVAAIALNTRELSEAEARAAIRAAERETGLPATDPVRFDARPLVEAVLSLGRKEVGI